MADLTYTGKGVIKRDATSTVIGKGEAGTVKHVTSIVEIASGATVGQTWKIARVPSNARFTGASELYWDDMSTASPDLDIGLASVDSNITSDPDAVNDGLDLGTASAGVKMIKTLDNIGLPAWDYVNGQTSDPGGELDLYASMTVATAELGGTLVVDLYYEMD